MRRRRPQGGRTARSGEGSWRRLVDRVVREDGKLFAHHRSLVESGAGRRTPTGAPHAMWAARGGQARSAPRRRSCAGRCRPCSMSETRIDCGRGLSREATDASLLTPKGPTIPGAPAQICTRAPRIGGRSNHTTREGEPHGMPPTYPRNAAQAEGTSARATGRSPDPGCDGAPCRPRPRRVRQLDRRRRHRRRSDGHRADVRDRGARHREGQHHGHDRSRAPRHAARQRQVGRQDEGCHQRTVPAVGVLRGARQPRVRRYRTRPRQGARRQARHRDRPSADPVRQHHPVDAVRQGRPRHIDVLRHS